MIAPALLEWEEGYRRLRDVRDPARRERLLAQLELVTDELRRRLGTTFTLAELVQAYAEAERWSREAVSERASSRDWVRDLTTVADASFHLYARGATDYKP